MDEIYEWDSTYVQMHPVDPKVSLSKAGLRRNLQGQGKLGRTTKDDGRPDLDLKQKSKRNACFVFFNSAKSSSFTNYIFVRHVTLAIPWFCLHVPWHYHGVL